MRGVIRIPMGKFVILLWLAVMVTCLWILTRANYTADLSAFLPQTPNQEQQLLIDQLRSGIASRLILIGIEGADPATRAQTSRDLAARLRTDPRFLHIANGETHELGQDQRFLIENRYLLSTAITPDRFTEEGLRKGIQYSLDLLATSMGLFSKALLPRDPTGELLCLLEVLARGSRPQLMDGVWASRDGQRALLLARTRSEGADTDGQSEAVTAIRAAFQSASGPGTWLVMTGPGPFSVAARATIKGQVMILSGLGSLIIIGLLMMAYRSALTVLLGLLPVVSGALAGVAAVSIGFGVVHGVTLGFGAALIGEAVDYSIYLFIQSESKSFTTRSTQDKGVEDWWPTIRIGVLTSILGFASLLFSSFPGLAQLGLYAITGLVTAALVTRFVLPTLLPANLPIPDLTAAGRYLLDWFDGAWRLRGLVLLLSLASVAILVAKRDDLWSRELAALSPVPAADQALDQAMRTDLGAPDVRYLVIVTASDRETALSTSEGVATQLQGLETAGVIEGFDNPAAYLPSQKTQLQRLASLPPESELRQRFYAASAGLPIKADRFEPFFTDVAKTRDRSPLTPEDLQGTSLGEGLDALLFLTEGRWTALLPLRVGTTQDFDGQRVRDALAELDLAGVYFIDLKGELDRLYAGYVHQAILLSLAGLGAIIGLLFAATRSLDRVFRIVAPLVSAVAVVIAGLVLAGISLTILHLVAMLLIVAVGSNYALFFDRGAAAGGISPRILASLMIAVATTVTGFGILGFSSVPVLNAIGTTVGPGALLALAFSAILARRA